jgi:hypothetical protein
MEPMSKNPYGFIWGMKIALPVLAVFVAIALYLQWKDKQITNANHIAGVNDVTGLPLTGQGINRAY